MAGVAEAGVVELELEDRSKGDLAMKTEALASLGAEEV